MKIRISVLGGLISIFLAMFVLSEPVDAANFTVSNCFVGGPDYHYIGYVPLNEASFNAMVKRTIGNESSLNFTIHLAGSGNGTYVSGVTVNGTPASPEIITWEQNSHMGPEGLAGSCENFVFYDHIPGGGASQINPTEAYKLLDKDGKETGYALRVDCSNLLRYTPTVEEWSTVGETEILTDSEMWVKGHTQSNPMQVERGATVQWRHRITVDGSGAPPITANTVSSSGVTAGFSNKSVASTGMPWEVVNWTVPPTAANNTVYCQYIRWSPTSTHNSGESNSRIGPPGAEQCVIVRVGEIETCTAPDGTQWPIGSPQCEPDIPGSPGSPPTAPKSAKVFSSYVRAQAVRARAQSPNSNRAAPVVEAEAADACSTGDGTLRIYTGSQGAGKSGCGSKTTTAPTTFAKPQDSVSFAYEGMLVALNNETTDDSATDQSGNWRNFPAFSVSHTLCGSDNDSTLGRNCTKTTPANGHLSLNLLGRPLQPLNLKNRCTLAGPTGLSAASPNCPGENNINLGLQNIRVNNQSNAHIVGNSDLGKQNISQTVSIQDVVAKKFMNCDDSGEISDYVADCTQDATATSPYRYTYSYEYGDEDNPSTGTDSYTEVRYHWVKRVETGPISSTASFNIPYNYTIVPQMSISPANAERIQIGGTGLRFQGSLRINPRYNAEVGETYATATRPSTRWAVVEFYVGPNRTSNPNAGINLTPSGVMANPCSFYQYDSNGANGLQNVPWGCQATQGSGSLNTPSGTTPFNLWNGSLFELSTTTRIIADAPIGTKYCVSMAVMDRNSTYNNGYGDLSGGLWTLTQPECVVVGKMPMANVIAGGLYSDGMIEGAIFEKQPQPQTGITNSTSPCPVGTGNMCAFGSWGEYEVVSNSAVYTFASGAALGVGAGGVPFGLTTASTLLSGNLMTGSCQIALLTFANSGCSPTSTTAPLGNMGGANNAHGMARNIRHRYSNYNDSYTAAERAARGIQVVDGFGGGSISNYNQRMNYLKSSGSITIEASTIQPGRTVVIDTPGTVTINGNITLSNGPYTDISQIPQVLIFAGSININSTVSQVDAWLLAGLNGGSGSINTCAGASGVSSVAALDSSKCTTRLAVNGPVMASRVALHRTHGAGIGMPASARPAEVFYLSPATYLWAYNQSSNLRQAYLTYAREVAPRF